MSPRAALNISTDASFEAHFLANVKEYSDIVDCYVRALPDEQVAFD
jgi:hypothetical protein